MGLLAGARSAARPGSSVSSVTKRCRLCSATKRSWNSCSRFLVLISLNLRMDGRQSCSLDLTETSLECDSRLVNDASSGEDLVAGGRSREAGRLSHAVRSHASWVSLRLAHRCADPGVVDEVLQDTFVLGVEGATRYGDLASLPEEVDPHFALIDCRLLEILRLTRSLLRGRLVLDAARSPT